MTKEPKPAFPNPAFGTAHFGQGMSLRDYFAAMAMQGLLTGLQWTHGRIVHSENELASDAYGFSDAMLIERERVVQSSQGKEDLE